MRQLLAPNPGALDAGAISPAVCNEPNTSDTGQYTTYDLSSGGTFSITGGNARITTDAGGSVRFCKTGSDLSSGKFIVLATIASRTIPGGSPAYHNCGVGIVLDGTHYLLADYDDVVGAKDIRLGWDVGSGFTMAGNVTRSLTAPYQLALCCDGGKRVQMWTKTSGGVWTFGTSADVSTPFPWGSMTWTGWKAGFGAASPNTGAAWNFDNLKAAQRYR